MIKLSSERVLANNKEVQNQRDENLATNMMFSDKIADFSQILTRFLVVYLVGSRFTSFISMIHLLLCRTY